MANNGLHRKARLNTSTLLGWRIEHLDTEQSPQSNGMPTASPQQAFAEEPIEEEDDLPF